jgi:hypothetical protein
MVLVLLPMYCDNEREGWMCAFLRKRKQGKRKRGQRLGDDPGPKVAVVMRDAPSTPGIEARRIDFVFVLVRAASPERLAERIGQVADDGIERGATLYHIVGPMVIMAFGTFDGEAPRGSRPDLVKHLREGFGGNIKIVHGTSDAHVGCFGSDRRLAFTFAFPLFNSVLATLGRLEFGVAEEIIA